MNTEQRLQALTHDLDIAVQRINALEDTLGGLTMLAMRALPADKRQAFAESLAALAATAEKQQDIACATLLTDLHRSAVQSARG